MNNIAIPVTVEFSAEDRARLDRFNVLMDAYLKRTEPVLLKCEGPTPAALAEAALAAPVAPAEENPPEAEKPAEAAPVPSADELRALVQKLVAAGHRDDVKAIVQQYAARVGDVPEDKRAECIEKLQALEVRA